MLSLLISHKSLFFSLDLISDFLSCLITHITRLSRLVGLSRIRRHWAASLSRLQWNFQWSRLKSPPGFYNCNQIVFSWYLEISKEEKITRGQVWVVGRMWEAFGSWGLYKPLGAPQIVRTRIVQVDQPTFQCLSTSRWPKNLNQTWYHSISQECCILQGVPPGHGHFNIGRIKLHSSMTFIWAYSVYSSFVAMHFLHWSIQSRKIVCKVTFSTPSRTPSTAARSWSASSNAKPARHLLT
jgi:hypothetical protein